MSKYITIVPIIVLGFSGLCQAQQENTEISTLKKVPSRSLASPKDNSPKQAFSSNETPPVTTINNAPVIRRMERETNQRENTSGGNLPGFALRTNTASFEASESPIKIAKDAKRFSPLDLGRGDIVSARITQDLIGYEEAESPVRAVITEGYYKGAWLIGNASLDKKTKNILVKFSTFKSPDLEVKIEGTVHSVSGELGLKGEFQSNYWSYFVAEVVASGVSGYANASTERHRGLLGYSEIVPSPAASANQAVASAAAKTSDKFAERARQAPEYTVLKGPTQVQVFITKSSQDL